jgi:hypothetical protein
MMDRTLRASLADRPWRTTWTDPNGTRHTVPSASFEDAIADALQRTSPRRHGMRVWRVRGRR